MFFVFYTFYNFFTVAYIFFVVSHQKDSFIHSFILSLYSKTLTIGIAQYIRQETRLDKSIITAKADINCCLHWLRGKVREAQLLGPLVYSPKYSERERPQHQRLPQLKLLPLLHDMAPTEDAGSVECREQEGLLPVNRNVQDKRCLVSQSKFMKVCSKWRLCARSPASNVTIKSVRWRSELKFSSVSATLWCPHDRTASLQDSDCCGKWSGGHLVKLHLVWPRAFYSPQHSFKAQVAWLDKLDAERTDRRFGHAA